MKEKLKELRKLNEELIKERQLFEDMKDEFSYNVELNSEDELYGDPYQMAKAFNNFNKTAILRVKDLRKSHPRYGEKRLKNEITKIFRECYQQEGAYEIIKIEEFIDNNVLEMVDDYLLYDSCGFFKVLDQEDKIDCLEQTIIGVKDELLDESKEAVSSIGTGAINILKPYGEVAKGQLNDAANMAKGLINKGSKKLVKILQKIEDKTNE